jgi:23S rRNA pseudouridine1911/1915/1917 synthase
MAMNRGWSYREQIGAGGAGLTLLDHLAGTRTHSTPSEWAGRLGRGEVELEGARADGNVILRAGQTVVWHRPPWDEPDAPSHFEVLYEDEAIVAVDKPSGLQTMPAGGFLNHTLLARVREQYPEASPLHRLGRYTSGIVVFARTHEAASALSKAWRDHEVRKIYRALGSGVAIANTFPIDAAIGPVPHPTLGLVHAASAEGKPSHSMATVLERRADCTLFSVEIQTGRPHQIRIHLACAGHPLVGDPLYEIGGTFKPQPGLPGEGGYLLHAERLSFAHPVTGAPMIISAGPPHALLTRAELY